MRNLSDIEVFVEVITRKGFTAAAEALGSTKSATSKAVTRLEDQLGVKLMQRTTRKLNLTEEGRRFYERAHAALLNLADAQQEASNSQSQVKGKLRISAPMSFGITLLARLLPAFMQKHPKLTVELHLEDRFSELILEGFDVAIRIADLKDSEYMARKLGEISHVTVATRTYLERHGEPKTPEELLAHKCLIYTYRASPHLWPYTAPNGETYQVRVSGFFECNNSLALREATLSGAGIALMPSYLVQADIESGSLQVLLTEYSSFTRGLYAVVPNRKHLSAKTKAFLEFLKQSREVNPANKAITTTLG